MKKILLQNLKTKFTEERDLKLFTLGANKVLLEGRVGSGKTYFISKVIEKILKDENANTNFLLTNAHGDFSELSSKLLDLNYKLFIFNSGTSEKFVKIHKFDSTLSVSTCEPDDEEIWNSLMTEPKTAVVVNVSNIGDKDLYTSLVTNCMNQLIEKDPLEDVKLITVFDDFEYMFDFYNLEKESNDTMSGLVTELFEKYCDLDEEHSKIVFSGQCLLRISVFSDLIKTKPNWKCINISTDF